MSEGLKLTPNKLGPGGRTIGFVFWGYADILCFPKLPWNDLNLLLAESLFGSRISFGFGYIILF